MSAFLKGLSKSRAPVYVLAGGEDFLCSEAEAAIACEVLGPEDADAATVFHGPTRKNDVGNLPLASVLDELQTRSMFTPHRLVVIRGAGHWIAAHSDALTRYIENAPGFATLVLSVRKLDGRIKFTKRAKEVGVIVDCRTLYDSDFGERVPSAGSELGQW